MDIIERNSSDSDLSDDWNVIDAKDAPPVVSEGESIEVLEEEEENDRDGDENDEGGGGGGASQEEYCERLKESDKDNREESALKNLKQSHDIESPESEASDVQLVYSNNQHATYFCVFPEEYHNVFTDSNYSNVNTSEVLCSISLIILCTIASSLMVINTDNLMPSFLDVLVWQSLPDNQKDININNPGRVLLKHLRYI